MPFGITTNKCKSSSGAKVRATMHTAQGQRRSTTMAYDHALSLLNNEMLVAEKLAREYNCKLAAKHEYDYIMVCGKRVWIAFTP